MRVTTHNALHQGPPQLGNGSSPLCRHIVMYSSRILQYGCTTVRGGCNAANRGEHQRVLVSHQSKMFADHNDISSH
jgi:hypothetical protein